jgi:dUTPase
LKVNDTWNEKFANKRKKKIENNIPMEYAVSVIENDKVEIVEPIKSTSKETSAIPIIGIRRVDDTVSIPEYEDEEACSFPLYSRVNISIRPGSSVNVPCNIKAKILNDDYVLVIIPDNTIAINNEVGILGAPIFFKNSYEEITIRMINYSHGTGAQSFNIVKGQKIAELTVVKSVKAEINEI